MSKKPKHGNRESRKPKQVGKAPPASPDSGQMSGVAAAFEAPKKKPGK
jgi:hypothetical protein